MVQRSAEEVNKSSNGFIAFFMVFKYCLTFEKQLSIGFRIKGFPCFRPSQIVAFLLMLFYILSPIDLLPEMWIRPIVFAFIDDALIFAAGLIYTLYDILGFYVAKAGESNGKSKKKASS